MCTVTSISSIHNWNMPTVCPACGSKIILSDNHKQMYCSNKSGCPSYAEGKLACWTRTIGAKDFGVSTIQDIVKLGFASIADLYEDKVYDALKKLDGYGDKSINSLKKEIAEHKNMSFAKFISGFNLDGFGETQIQKILDFTKKTSVTELSLIKDVKCEGIGDELSKRFVDEFALKLDEMKKVEKLVTIESEKKISSGSKLSGLSFCFTGKACMPRSKLEEMVIANGGSVSAVKKGLSYLVTDDENSSSSKFIKATKLGVKKITSKEFLELIT